MVEIAGVDDSYRLTPVPAPSTLSEKAYSTIKEAILSLGLEPGAALVEDDLASQLGISKTPVRDALLALEREGLVTRVPYKGTYVTEIREKDAREIFELRAVLEGLAGRLALESLTQDELDEAETFLDQSERALAAGDLQQASVLGARYHRFIITRAPNQRLLAFLEILDDQTRRLRYISNRGPGRLTKSIRQHRKILSALRRGDPERVEAAFRHHLDSVLQDLRVSETIPEDEVPG